MSDDRKTGAIGRPPELRDRRPKQAGTFHRGTRVVGCSRGDVALRGCLCPEIQKELSLLTRLVCDFAKR